MKGQPRRPRTSGSSKSHLHSLIHCLLGFITKCPKVCSLQPVNNFPSKRPTNSAQGAPQRPPRPARGLNSMEPMSLHPTYHHSVRHLRPFQRPSLQDQAQSLVLLNYVHIFHIYQVLKTHFRSHLHPWPLLGFAGKGLEKNGTVVELYIFIF